MSPTQEVTKTAQIKNFIAALISLQNQLRLYDSANKSVELGTEKVISILNYLLDENNELTIFVGQHALIFEDQFIERSNPLFESFANLLFNHGISAITFVRGVNAAELHDFMRLSGRRSSFSWDEGGISAAMQQRNVKNIVIREMSELDFSLEDEVLEDIDVCEEDDSSPLWQRYAFSIVYGLHPETSIHNIEVYSPKKLAELTRKLLEESAGSRDEPLAKDLTRFLLSLKNAKVHVYRAATMKMLSEFVSEMTPQVRRLFLGNVFNMDIDAEMCEGFLRGVSDQVIMDALQNASVDPGYAPPVALQLLGRLASERSLPVTAIGSVSHPSEKSIERIAELFREDDFAKYVPQSYQNALITILKTKKLPSEVQENLLILKQSIHPGQLDKHIGEILMLILDGSVEVKDLGMLKKHLKDTIDHYLENKEFIKISGLLDICCREQNWQNISFDINEHVGSGAFINRMLDNLLLLEKEKSLECIDLILKIGTPFIPVLMNRLSIEDNRSFRRIYLNVLVRFGANCINHAVSRLNDSRWFVVRNMLYLLRELGDQTVLPHIRQCMKHPNSKVSLEALKTCLFYHDKEAVPFLLNMLKSENEEELLHAVSLATLFDNHEIIDALAAMLLDSGVLNFHLELKKAIIRNLAVASPNTVLPVFATMLAAHNIFHGKQLETLKLEIVTALEKMPGEDSRKLLLTLRNNESAAVAKSAKLALERSGGGKHEP